MKIDNIMKKFSSNGYKTARCASGKIYVKQPNGFSKLFKSYNQAYNYYFGFVTGH